jgi:hypothetical protein
MTLTQDERAAGGPTAVLKLQRSLYRLKQASRLRNNMLQALVIAIGNVCCKTDLCLYYKHKRKSIAIVGIYVDDRLAIATSNHGSSDKAD